MGDVFKEQIIKKVPTAQDSIKKTGITIIGVIIIAILGYFAIWDAFFRLIAVFLIFGVGFGIHYLTSQFNVEFEYIFTNGELDIDVIYNKQRRKHLLSVDAKNMEVFARANDESRFASCAETLDFSSGVPNENTYAFATPHLGKKHKIIIEPNEKLLNAMLPYLGQRKFLK